MIGRQRERAAARLGGVQVEHRHHVAAGDAAQRARRPAHADVHRRRDVAEQLAQARRDEEALARGENGGAPEKDEGVLNGVGVGDITPEVRSQLQVPARIKGALITSVEADSPAAKQGLREGDIILELDRKPVANADQAVKLSEQIKGPKVLVLIWRAGRIRYLAIDESK